MTRMLDACGNWLAIVGLAMAPAGEVIDPPGCLLVRLCREYGVAKE